MYPVTLHLHMNTRMQQETDTIRHGVVYERHLLLGAPKSLVVSVIQTLDQRWAVAQHYVTW